MTVSLSSLEKSALWRLRRAALTEKQLYTGLKNKLRREGHANDPDALRWIDEVVAKMKRLGFIDDERTAAARTRSLRAAGTSKRGVLMKLRQKGIDADTAQRALAAVDDVDGADSELEAARAYARKRRLQNRDREKALAALARRGFAFSVARRVLDELHS